MITIMISQIFSLFVLLTYIRVLTYYSSLKDLRVRATLRKKREVVDTLLSEVLEARKDNADTRSKIKAYYEYRDKLQACNSYIAFLEKENKRLKKKVKKLKRRL